MRLQSSQFDGRSGQAQARITRRVSGKTIKYEAVWRREPIEASVAANGGGAVAGDELGAILFFLREGGIGFEAAAAAGFVSAHRADNNQLFTLDQALGVNGRIAAAHTDGKQLGDFFGDSEEARHRFEGAAAVIGVQARDDDALAEIGQLFVYNHPSATEKLRFVDADNFGARRQLLHDFRGLEDGV